MFLDKCHTKTFVEKAKTNPVNISPTIIQRIKNAGRRYFANDNISEFISNDEKQLLIEEVTVKFSEVLKSLVIDTDNDPNSEDTAYRLAKMYITELMSGRYDEAPNCTAFPNENIAGFQGNEGSEVYRGMLVIRADIKSVCSHHWQPVWGTAYIGIIPDRKVLGLSKYTRIAQWTSRRGTLQEQLCNQIANNIMKTAECSDVAVYIEAKHGCCSFRGIGMDNSTTQTTTLHGMFKEDAVKKEFFDNIQLQKK